MPMLKRLLPLMIYLIFTTSAHAFLDDHIRSYIEACAKVLQFTEVSVHDDRIFQYALLGYMVQSSRDESDFNAKFSNLSSSGFFDGTFRDARAKFNYLEQQLQLHWDQHITSSYVMKYLAPNVTTAFSECVSKVFSEKGVLHVSLSEQDQSTVSVQTSYWPQSSTDPSPDYRFKLFSNGNFPRGQDVRMPITGGTNAFAFVRINPSKVLEIRVDLTSRGVTIGSTSLFVPPQMHSEETTTKVRLSSLDTRDDKNQRSSVTCSGNGDWHYKSGNLLILQTSDVEAEFDKNSIASPIFKHESGSGGCGNPTVSVQVLPSAPPFKTITAMVGCEPGPNKDHFCDVSTYILATQTKLSIRAVSPPDNQKPVPDLRQVSGSPR